MSTRTQIASTAYVFYLKDEEMPEQKDQNFILTRILYIFGWSANYWLLLLDFIDMISPIWILNILVFGFFDFLPLYIWLIVMGILSIYIIMTNKPFIFFESAVLEKVLLFLLAIDNIYISIGSGITAAIVTYQKVDVHQESSLWLILIPIIIAMSIIFFTMDLGYLYLILFSYKSGDESKDYSRSDQFEQYIGDKN